MGIFDEQAISPKTKTNIIKPYERLGLERIFGRADVVEVLDITEIGWIKVSC